jgi:hypothetical protein
MMCLVVTISVLCVMSMLVSNKVKCFKLFTACLLELNLHEKKANRDVNMEENTEEGGIFVDPSYC